MKKILALFTVLVLVASISVAGYSANADITLPSIDLSSVSEALKTTQESQVTAYVLTGSQSGSVSRTEESNSVIFEAVAADDYTFSAWYTSALDYANGGEAYSTDAKITVSKTSDTKIYYAVFVSAATTESTEESSSESSSYSLPSLTITIPSSVTIPTTESTATDTTATETSDTEAYSTTKSAATATANSSMVALASSVMKEFDQVLAEANGSTTTTTTTTTATVKTSVVSKPNKTSIKKLSKGKKKITVQWKKVSGVKGYQVQVATNKKFTKNKKTVTISKQKTTKTTIKKLKSKKKYYVRVRTYKVANGKKVYSKWSKVKTVKTK